MLAVASRFCNNAISLHGLPVRLIALLRIAQPVSTQQFFFLIILFERVKSLVECCSSLSFLRLCMSMQPTTTQQQEAKNEKT